MPEADRVHAIKFTEIWLPSCGGGAFQALKIQHKHDIFILRRWLQSQMAATLLNDYPACTHSLICTAHPHNRTHKTECGQNCSCLNECCHCGDYLLNSFQILHPIGIVEFAPFIRLWCLMSIFAESVGSVQWLNRSFRLKLDAKKKKKCFPAED